MEKKLNPRSWRVGGGTQKLCSSVDWCSNNHEGSTCMWTREGCKLHGVTNASSKHALVQVHEQTQQNARE